MYLSFVRNLISSTPTITPSDQLIDIMNDIESHLDMLHILVYQKN